MLIAGLMLGGLAFLSLGLSASYAWLIATAVLAGLANCVYHPADYAMLTDSISEDRIGRAFSVHTFAGFVGGAIAPPLLLGFAAVGGRPVHSVFARPCRAGDGARAVPHAPGHQHRLVRAGAREAREASAR